MNATLPTPVELVRTMSSEEKEAVAQYGSSDSGASLGDILGAALKKATKKGKKDEEEGEKKDDKKKDDKKK